MKQEIMNIVKRICEISIYFAIVALCTGMYLMIVFAGERNIDISVLGISTTVMDISSSLMITGAIYVIIIMAVFLVNSYSQINKIEETNEDVGISFK
jgi:hypothetical protein